ncbi:MAG TPA: glycine cleavage system protein GcvH [Anaerolineaceae bacterium]
MVTPADLKYTKSDEWVKVDGTIGTIGITDYAQEQLSDVVFFEAIVSVGDQVMKETEIATVESVKAAATVSSPIAGEVIEINEGLADAPEIINSDPYGKGWMIKVQIKDPAALNNLMSSDAYDTYCQGRSH